MLDLAHALPAEEEQTEQGRLKEERHQRFDRQRRTEDIADVMGVIGPVGAELEFHCQAGGNPQGEVDTEQLAPELGHVTVDGLAGHYIDRLHDRQQKSHTQRQRDKQEVNHRRQGELHSGELYNIHLRTPLGEVIVRPVRHRRQARLSEPADTVCRNHRSSGDWAN